MRDDHELSMRRYTAAARAHHDTHPEDEIALHEHHLNSLGLSEAAKAHIVHNRLASVAAYIGGNDGLRKQMAGLDDASQVAAIQKIHEGEGRGGGVDSEGEREESETDRTENYIKSRAGATRGSGLGTTYGGKAGRGGKYG